MAKKNPVVSVEPRFDFQSKKLRKGQRAPKGWRVVTITAADLPADWPADKPYLCPCGCGKTVRVGDRIAIRNVQIYGLEVRRG